MKITSIPQKIFLILFIVACILPGCTEKPSFVQPVFDVALEANAGQEVEGVLLLTNKDDTVFPADDVFEGELNLWYENAEPRSSAEIEMIESIEPGESIPILINRWHLDPGVYFITWGAPKYGGVLTVFSVDSFDGQVVLGEQNRFRTKPANYGVEAYRAGVIETFSWRLDGAIVIAGQTPLPDEGCLYPLLFDSRGLVDGIPIGLCARISDGHWQLTFKPESGQEIDRNEELRILLFSDDLTIPPSEPFIVDTSPPSWE